MIPTQPRGRSPQVNSRPVMKWSVIAQDWQRNARRGVIHGLLVSAGNQDTEKQRRWQRWEWIRFPFTFRAFLPARTFVLQVQKVETNTQNSNADRRGGQVALLSGFSYQHELSYCKYKSSKPTHRIATPIARSGLADRGALPLRRVPVSQCLKGSEILGRKLL